MCSATCGDSGPMSLPCSFDIPDELKNWLRVQRVASRLHRFGQQIPLCSTRFQPRDCRSLLNLLLLLNATGFSAAFPLTRRGMHPSVALEKSTLRRMSLVQYSSCCRFPRSCRHPRTFRCNGTRCGGGTCRNTRR